MATESPRLRAVFDTNAIIAALKSNHPDSPNVELIRRWQNGEFDLLYSLGLRSEYSEKFETRSVESQRSKQFLASLTERGILIDVPSVEVAPVITQDPDDDVILTCATKGKATHLVTYDPHFDSLGEIYRGVQILRPLYFLYLVRGDTPSRL